MAILVYFGLLLRFLDNVSGNRSVYYSKNNSGSNPDNDPGNNGWNKVFILITAIVVTFILLINCYFYDILYLFEFYRPSVIGKKLADFLTSYNLFMNPTGGNPGGYDPIRDAVHINEQQAAQEAAEYAAQQAARQAAYNAYLANEMLNGYGNTVLGGGSHNEHHSRINSLYACLEQSNVDFKRQVLTLAKENIQNCSRFQQTNLRSIVALKYIDFDLIDRSNISGLNRQFLNDSNILSSKHFGRSKPLMLGHLQTNIDNLP